MDNALFFGAAALTGILLQFLVRISSRITSRKGKLIMNILKAAALLGIQLLLLAMLGYYGAFSYVSSIAVSCVTFLIGAGSLAMQYLSDRKYPMTDEQKMKVYEM